MSREGGVGGKGREGKGFNVMFNEELGLGLGLDSQPA